MKANTSMRRTKARQALALVGIVALLFGALTASAWSGHLAAVLVPLWFVVPVIPAVVIRRPAARCDEQLSSLLSLFLSRAPPARVVV